MNKKLAGELVVTLFHARTAAHILHLQTKSYAEHVALNEFYDGVVDLADAIAEAFQGIYGLLEFPKESYKQPTDAVRFLTQLRSWVADNREDCCPDTEIQNMIDEVLSLIDSTLYKLRFLS
jgi:hypothetical protein